MEELSLLDEEEKILLIGSCLSLLFTCSFIISYIKAFRHKIHYSQIPILVITFGYLNNLVWYYYSDLIYHDYMRMANYINYIIYIILMLIYLIYEYKEDKIDTILNILIVITASWAIKKLLIDIFNDEDKVKYSCIFSTVSLFVVFLEWLFRAYKEKNRNILNIFSAFCLISISACYVVYGLKFEELYFFVPNIIGIIIGCIYIGVWLYLKRKYGNIIFEEKEDKEDFDNEINDDKKIINKMNEEEETIVNKNN